MFSSLKDEENNTDTLKVLVYPFPIMVCGGCVFLDHVSTLPMYLFIT